MSIVQVTIIEKTSETDSNEGLLRGLAQLSVEVRIFPFSFWRWSNKNGWMSYVSTIPFYHCRANRLFIFREIIQFIAEFSAGLPSIDRLLSCPNPVLTSNLSRDRTGARTEFLNLIYPLALTRLALHSTDFSLLDSTLHSCGHCQVLYLGFSHSLDFALSLTIA